MVNIIFTINYLHIRSFFHSRSNSFHNHKLSFILRMKFEVNKLSACTCTAVGGAGELVIVAVVGLVRTEKFTPEGPGIGSGSSMSALLSYPELETEAVLLLNNAKTKMKTLLLNLKKWT